MKKLLPLLFLALTSLTVSARDWHTYKDPFKVFTVRFPAAPATTVKDIPSKAGVLKAHFAVYNAVSDAEANKKYLASITAVPKNRSRDIEDTYDALMKGVKGSVRNNKATLIDARRIMMDGRPAMEAVMTTNNGTTIIRSKTFFVKDYHVGLMVYTSVKKKDNADCKQFFASFALIK
ncbi:hypothetical protein AMR72_10930 [Flavobacterium psychrophilum]|nr:hypothetical protein AMR72_10930 [Flavobacterium psychrophilum]AOE52981.1 hypothetical protein ALW18_10920 [Flavobacterium psychrophilum]